MAFENINLWKLYKREYKSLFRLGFPVLVTELGVILVSFADTMMVGSYGTNELAAAAFVNNLFLVAVLMLIGFAGGVTPIVGKLYGAKKHFEAGQILRVSTQLNAALGLLFTIIMGALYFFVDKMGQPDELLPLIRPYYIIVLCSLLPIAVFNCWQQMANGTTDTAMPMFVMLGMNIINVTGNYILIFGKFGAPELGLIGAGFSTFTARWAGALCIVLYILFNRRYRCYREGLLMNVPLHKERKYVFKTSYPVMIQSGIETMLWSFGAVVCGWFGAQQLAGYQVTVTISQIGFMTYISFGIATSIRVSNNMGIGDFNAIRRIATAGLHINLFLGTVASTIFFLSGRNLPHMFTSDVEVVAVSVSLIAPLILYQYLDAIQITYINALRGTSHVKPLLWISLVAYILVGLPSVLILSITFGLKSTGVYYSFSCALLVAAIMSIIAFRRAVANEEALSKR